MRVRMGLPRKVSLPGRPLTPYGQDPARQPAARIVAMTDREDGVVWYVTFAADESAYVHITTVAPPDVVVKDVKLYGDAEGPWLPGGLRLFIRSGRLGYDMPGRDVNTGPTVARRKWKRYGLYLQLGPWRNPGDTLGYKEIST